jgi:hypothetical protein
MPEHVIGARRQPKKLEQSSFRGFSTVVGMHKVSPWERNSIKGALRREK